MKRLNTKLTTTLIRTLSKARTTSPEMKDTASQLLKLLNNDKAELQLGSTVNTLIPELNKVIKAPNGETVREEKHLKELKALLDLAVSMRDKSPKEILQSLVDREDILDYTLVLLTTKGGKFAVAQELLNLFKKNKFKDYDAHQKVLNHLDTNGEIYPLVDLIMHKLLGNNSEMEEVDSEFEKYNFLTVINKSISKGQNAFLAKHPNAEIRSLLRTPNLITEDSLTQKQQEVTLDSAKEYIGLVMAMKLIRLAEESHRFHLSPETKDKLNPILESINTPLISKDIISKIQSIDTVAVDGTLELPIIFFNNLEELMARTARYSEFVNFLTEPVRNERGVHESQIFK